MIWLTQLSLDHPIRGGIELGTAIKIDKNEVYGRALAEAHFLESRKAKGPRIVVGKNLVSLLSETQALTEDPDMDIRIAAAFARRSLSLLRQDHDGAMVVDVVGRFMESLCPDEFWKMFTFAHDNVRSQLLRHSANNDSKLVLRYTELLDCFDKRAESRRHGEKTPGANRHPDKTADASG